MAWKLPTVEEVKKRAAEAADAAGQRIVKTATDIANDPKGAVDSARDKLSAAGSAVRKGFDDARQFGQDAAQALRDLRNDIVHTAERVDAEITKLPETVQDLKMQLARKINQNSGAAGNAVEKGLDAVDKYSNYLSVRGAIVTIAAGALRKNAKSLVGDATGALAKAIRGDKLAFIDTIVEELSPYDKVCGKKPSVQGIIYIPMHEKADKNGIGVFPELTLLELEHKAHNVPEDAAVFREARVAVQEKKRELGLRVQTTLNDEGPDAFIPHR